MNRRAVSSFDCEVLRCAFVRSVIEDGIPEDRWAAHAALLIRELTGKKDVDQRLLDWVLQSSSVPQFHAKWLKA
ncbi:hypothetical protein EN794_053945 [Mesorhizobium sp. M00.F.Ca.ET.151.01.1.1]|uniref:hypothetical protein n=1 Tax=Mesorhizobium sp. M4B.F.Ca.ET.019.03.1.1 TaxID=2496651 RepID=UPI0012812CC3|nr:hypothetical protein [Mesorhizobium sp. M4B.F.Ca.ET.019.03.1.1]TGU85124.1 hypothetical protein EN794_053945 [Mesorhizobium sp. M00.F.Ca.ET.151.01.1.1]